MLKQLRLLTRWPSVPRADWARMEAEHDYFCQVLTGLLEDFGFEVLGQQVHQDPLENQARECLFFLQRERQAYIALGLRWLTVITSDVIGRCERGLCVLQADGAMIFTTSLFTDAAMQAARGPAIQLYDRHKLCAQLKAG
jgi:hypothetical protein